MGGMDAIKTEQAAVDQATLRIGAEKACIETPIRRHT